MTEMSVVLSSTITCPQCGGVSKETMPTDACQFFYDCNHCAIILRPLAGDCCVFCSYADVPLPTDSGGQAERGCWRMLRAELMSAGR
jgi:hypothetical protein